MSLFIGRHLSPCLLYLSQTVAHVLCLIFLCYDTGNHENLIGVFTE